jgi:hypothetical protein
MGDAGVQPAGGMRVRRVAPPASRLFPFGIRLPGHAGSHVPSGRQYPGKHRRRPIRRIETVFIDPPPEFYSFRTRGGRLRASRILAEVITCESRNVASGECKYASVVNGPNTGTSLSSTSSRNSSILASTSTSMPTSMPCRYSSAMPAAAGGIHPSRANILLLSNRRLSTQYWPAPNNTTMHWHNSATVEAIGVG